MRKNLKFIIAAVIATLALGIIISYAATKPSGITEQASESYISEGIIGQKALTFVTKLNKEGVFNEYTLNILSSTRGGAFIHTNDADYYYNNYDNSGKPTADSVIEKIYLFPSYSKPLAEGVRANLLLSGLKGFVGTRAVIAENTNVNGINSFAVFVFNDGNEIGFYWEGGNDPNTTLANYICITEMKDNHINVADTTEGIDDVRNQYMDALVSKEYTDDSFEDDASEIVSESEFKAEAAKHSFKVYPNDILRDWNTLQGETFAYSGEVVNLETDGFVTNMLIEMPGYGDHVFACTFFEHVPVVEGDNISVWGYATDLMTYATTNANGVAKRHSTFQMEGRYYETAKTKDQSATFTADEKKFFFGRTYFCEAEQPASDQTYEIVLTENTINGEPYYLKNFRRESDGMISANIVLSNYEGYYNNAGGYHGTIVFYPSGRITIDDLRAFNGTDGFRINTIDWADGLPAHYVRTDYVPN